MQFSSFPCRLGALWLVAALLSVAAFAATAAPAGQTPAATNATPAEPEPPKSLFRIPGSAQEGRDPFFPQSALRKPAPIAFTNAPVAIVELELKGISGSAGRRLAIINNRTFEPGEEGTVLSNVGRVRLICKEITTDSVRVNVNGQDRILTLRSR
jgi:hypothetical protein